MVPSKISANFHVSLKNVCFKNERVYTLFDISVHAFFIHPFLKARQNHVKLQNPLTLNQPNFIMDDVNLSVIKTKLKERLKL